MENCNWENMRKSGVESSDGKSDVGNSRFLKVKGGSRAAVVRN